MTYKGFMIAKRMLVLNNGDCQKRVGREEIQFGLSSDLACLTCINFQARFRFAWLQKDTLFQSSFVQLSIRLHLFLFHTSTKLNHYIIPQLLCRFLKLSHFPMYILLIRYLILYLPSWFPYIYVILPSCRHHMYTV